MDVLCVGGAGKRNGSESVCGEAKWRGRRHVVVEFAECKRKVVVVFVVIVDVVVVRK